MLRKIISGLIFWTDFPYAFLQTYGEINIDTFLGHEFIFGTISRWNYVWYKIAICNLKKKKDNIASVLVQMHCIYQAICNCC